ncbi:putative oxidoreductase, aryl-alcohol dehydrogenase like protein [Acidovorax sp. CF316]|uniref:aldo/keto reductase n=1 Tax=Acidovorax sp. CF316 TaxID=1144317 RepID=UPI00026BC2C3|nr:aldo/keto reductase [Acidovorax sp. CF316]EJE53803.1 putative oxidoreductase, aryl-alcohol dehydrogenase like protein [Acidovorax sp. CF316]
MAHKHPALAQVQLGRSGPMVGAQGLGCMGMSEFYGAADAAQSQATLAQAMDLGATLLDTADMYGLGANESFLAPFLRAHRGRAVIATKFGYTRTADNPGDWSLDNRPAYIRAAAERSLQRLGVDTIDLYYMHRRSQEVPLADSIGAMADLVRAGKVRALGLCEVTADELRAAHAIHPIAALQSEWSLFSRQIEREVLPCAVALGIAIVPYAPLGRGLLTSGSFAGQLGADDARRNFPRFAADNQAANARLVAQVEQLAAARGLSAAQLALAWLHTQARLLGATAVPIPGTRKPSRLQQNVAAASIALTSAEMAALEPLASAVQGVAV